MEADPAPTMECRIMPRSATSASHISEDAMALLSVCIRDGVVDPTDALCSPKRRSFHQRRCTGRSCTGADNNKQARTSSTHRRIGQVCRRAKTSLVACQHDPRIDWKIWFNTRCRGPKIEHAKSKQPPKCGLVALDYLNFNRSASFAPLEVSILSTRVSGLFCCFWKGLPSDALGQCSPLRCNKIVMICDRKVVFHFVTNTALIVIPSLEPARRETETSISCDIHWANLHYHDLIIASIENETITILQGRANH